MKHKRKCTVCRIGLPEDHHTGNTCDTTCERAKRLGITRGGALKRELAMEARDIRPNNDAPWRREGLPAYLQD